MQDERKILVTSALIYANGAPHLGHLVGTIQADIWVRLQKMLGRDCLYICGSDSHGTPIMIQAEKMGMTPEALIKQTHQQQEKDFADFHIAFDNYSPTHSEENRVLVEEIFHRLLKKDYIEKRVIQQLFDPVKNMFLPDRYIKGECPNCHAKDQYGDNCEVCGITYAATELINPYSVLSGAKPIEKSSEHYFFKLEKFTDFLQTWTHADHLPREVANKLDEWFKQGLKKWDISRDAPYFGFLIPGEKDKYFYVWLDAPIGYMGIFETLCKKNPAIKFADYWESEQTELYHFIGKDIIYFHALFWPAMLHGAHYRTPTHLYVNGFLTIDGQKMSKSRGTFIRARTYLNHLNPEYLRYYFAAKLSSRIEDLDLNFDDFIQRINADLVGKFINIASRSASFINKNFQGQLATHFSSIALYDEFAKAGESIKEQWLKLDYSAAIRHIMALADRANQYIDEQKPWALIKDPKRAKEVQEVCTMGLNLFRLLMIYLKPVLPKTAAEVEEFLNIKPLTWEDKNHPLLNHTIRPFTPLLTRIDPKQIEEMKMTAQQETEVLKTAATTQAPAESPATSNTISIDDFSKVDLRIAKILSAEAVEGADKLLRLMVDVGEEKPRQIFAGIKAAYQPEQLVGRYVVVVANLAPRKMRFGMSEGMVLASGPGGSEIWLVSPDEGAKPGMKVK